MCSRYTEHPIPPIIRHPPCRQRSYNPGHTRTDRDVRPSPPAVYRPHARCRCGRLPYPHRRHPQRRSCQQPSCSTGQGPYETPVRSSEPCSTALVHATMAYIPSRKRSSNARVIPTGAIAVNCRTWLGELAIHRATLTASTCTGLHSGEGSAAAAGNAQYRVQAQAVRICSDLTMHSPICAAGRAGMRAGEE